MCNLSNFISIWSQNVYYLNLSHEMKLLFGILEEEQRIALLILLL